MSHAGNNSGDESVHHHDHVVRCRWLFVVGLGIVSLILGTIGFMKGGAHGHPVDVIDAFYNSVRLFHMHFEPPDRLLWQLHIARFLAPLVLGITLIKGFIFAVRGHERAFLHLSRQGHIVICGLGQKGLHLARKYRAAGEWVIVLEKNPQNELLSVCDHEGILCWIGDAAEAAVLKHARVAQAKEVIVVTPEDEANIRIAAAVHTATAGGQKSRTKCFVHIENIHLREPLERLLGPNAPPVTGCSLKFFNVYDAEARRVLLELPLDGEGIGKDDPRTVHVVIVGFGPMGRSLALRAARLGHFANGKPLRISVIDRDAKRHQEQFLFRYPMLEGGKICRMEFLDGEAQSLSVRRRIEDWVGEPDTLVHVFVCLHENATAIEVGLRLHEALSHRRNFTLRVRLKQRASIPDVLESAAQDGRSIKAFGMVEDTCDKQTFKQEQEELAAARSHDDFVTRRRTSSIRTPENDPALKLWEDLTADLRDSTRQQLDHIGIKLRAIGLKDVGFSEYGQEVTDFARHEIELLAELEHRRWNAERWLAGWRYGTPSDKARRINENLASWDELDDSIKQYDRDAVVDIPARLKSQSPPRKAVKQRLF